MFRSSSCSIHSGLRLFIRLYSRNGSVETSRGTASLRSLNIISTHGTFPLAEIYQRQFGVMHFSCSPIRSSFAGAPTITTKNRTELEEKRFHEITDETLDELTAFFEDLNDAGKCHPDYDVSYSNGVLTVNLHPGVTYVLNKQTPNRQIWFSSPISGPKRYDFVDGTWIYLHDGKRLHDLLSSEVSTILKLPVDFTNCAFGKPKANK